MEVQILGLLGGTLLHHWRQPPDLVCGDALPTDERAEQPHRSGAGESYPSNQPNWPRMRECAFGMHCGGPDLPETVALWQFLGQCLAELDPLAGRNRGTSTDLHHARPRILMWRLGALNGVGNSPEMMRSATTTTMHSALFVRHCFQVSSHVIFVPQRSAQHLDASFHCGHLGPPPHLGSWIDRPCNPLQDVADCGSVPCAVADLGLPHMNLDATVVPECVLDVTVSWTSTAVGVTMNVSSKNARSRSPRVKLVLAASKAPRCPRQQSKGIMGSPCSPLSP